jgi:dGTPase
MVASVTSPIADNAKRTARARTRPDYAVYAADPALSRGRLTAEPACDIRGCFQRDRDRIVHSSAFRRLTHKTQVFLYHEGDHYRTRLTHTIEVAQIARAIARQLRLDEDLTEALALAHDLGHPPFGHAGERALAEAAKACGGFDHNAQSLRVVTALERKYASFDGLNLTWELLEGLVKHNGPLTGAMSSNRHGPLSPVIAAYNARHDLWLDRFASAESQVAALADDIAYNSHDLDDGLRAGVIDIEALRDVPLIAGYINDITAMYGDLAGPQRHYEITRRLITGLVTDVAAEARRRLEQLSPADSDAIRNAEAPVVAFSAQMGERLGELSSFLFTEVYRSKRVMDVMRQAETMVAQLFGRYVADPALLPEGWRAAIAALPSAEQGARIVDFVAGMTDRYAIEEHRRLFDQTPDLV